jgi:esterase/lipase
VHAPCTAQALVIQSRGDTVIPENSADYVAARIGSHDVRLHRVERSNHAVTVDYDREEVAGVIISFFSE